MTIFSLVGTFDFIFGADDYLLCRALGSLCVRLFLYDSNFNQKFEFFHSLFHCVTSTDNNTLCIVYNRLRIVRRAENSKGNDNVCQRTAEARWQEFRAEKKARNFHAANGAKNKTISIINNEDK